MLPNARALAPQLLRPERPSQAMPRHHSHVHKALLLLLPIAQLSQPITSLPRLVLWALDSTILRPITTTSHTINNHTTDTTVMRPRDTDMPHMDMPQPTHWHNTGQRPLPQMVFAHIRAMVMDMATLCRMAHLPV